MKPYLAAYAKTAIAFLLLDGIWLGFIATSFFQEQLGHVLRDEINLELALVFYLFYAVGIVLFGVRPALAENCASPIRTAAIFGGLFGFFAYATYDMTNYITLADWPEIVVLVDVTWGTFASTASAVAGVWRSRSAPATSGGA